jgi:hypothetical protein
MAEMKATALLVEDEKQIRRFVRAALHLTPIEYRLLCQFTANEGMVLPIGHSIVVSAVRNIASHRKLRPRFFWMAGTISHLGDDDNVL